ncbi:vitamin B12 ABC transporter ATP-binding protein BtuD [Vibrio sp. SCSIO 43133]|uniref:vitamin B12 ABC transporter ATP-binding protein BtuD n=1 Tax=Vibrio sp. SCSIO 43133 TaxID=2802577 RepID=UPI002075303E|nr:vitamin B12 ABC transporter ATP-binding protein BtuD [Vibrio sp. SCSIO 43133]USE01801.1 vitamin B12 ABC transporter ATP-binding protein BtuD [Vibrio sp. SCSIO 43133]
MIQVHNLTIGTRLLPLTIDIPTGQLTHVIGPNGSGKSTLLAALAAVIDYQGDIVIEGTALSTLSLPDIALTRAYLSQSARPAFNMPVYQFLSLSIPANCRDDSEEVNRAILSIVELLNLDTMLSRTVHHLSGGEWQRVRLAACCLQVWKPINPLAKYLILDEPAAPLDIGQEKYLHRLIDLVTEQGTTVVVANHDLNVTLRRADNVVLLSNGVLEAVGSSQHVLTVENINSVYRTNVQKVEHNGRAYLIFED